MGPIAKDTSMWRRGGRPPSWVSYVGNILKRGPISESKNPTAGKKQSVGVQKEPIRNLVSEFNAMGCYRPINGGWPAGKKNNGQNGASPNEEGKPGRRVGAGGKRGGKNSRHHTVKAGHGEHPKRSTNHQVRTNRIGSLGGPEGHCRPAKNIITVLKHGGEMPSS